MSCGNLRSGDGTSEFSFLSILCGPGASSDDRKVEQLHAAVKAVDLEKVMLCLTKGTDINSKDKVRNAGCTGAWRHGPGRFPFGRQTFPFTYEISHALAPAGWVDTAPSRCLDGFGARCALPAEAWS